MSYFLDNNYNKITEYERETTAYAKELHDELKRYTTYKTNPSYYENYWGVNEVQKYTKEFEIQLLSKIKEKLSQWRYTYTENIAIMELGITYSEFINDSNEKKLYHNQLLNIIKKQKEIEEKLKQTKYEYSIKYKDKIIKLERQTKNYILYFLLITGSFIFSLIIWLIFGKLPISSQLIAFVFTKTTISITISVIIFWIAKFFNRRIHENVHLIESHEHRALLLDTFDILTQSVDTVEHRKEILDQILTVLITDPTNCLSRKKTDKIPTNEIIELLNSLQPYRVIENKKKSDDL